MRRLIVLAVLVVIIAGCASESGRNNQAAAAQDFANLLQSGASYDYDAFDSPLAQRDAADLVVLGTLGEVVPGRQLPYGRDSKQANLVVKVEEVIRGSSPDPQTAYVEVELGNGVEFEDVRDAAPVGQRLLLFLDDRTDIGGVNGERGRPSGSRIYTPFVQGLIIEAGGDWVSGISDRGEFGPEWRGIDSFDAFVTDLRDN